MPGPNQPQGYQQNYAPPPGNYPPGQPYQNYPPPKKSGGKRKGCIIALVILVSLGGFDVSAMRVNGFARRESEIMIGAGIVAGLVYWLIAGRGAGHWRAAPIAMVASPQNPSQAGAPSKRDKTGP